MKNAIVTHGYMTALLDALAEQGALDKERLAASLERQLEGCSDAQREYDHPRLIAQTVAHLRGGNEEAGA